MSVEPGRGWRLVAETGVVILLAAGALVAGFELVRTLGMSVAARGWVTVTTLVVAWEVGFLWDNRGANRPTDGGRRLATFGAANAVTILRGTLFAGVAGFVAVEPAGLLAWGPAALYGIGVSLDAVDGVVARRLGEPTTLGSRLDHAFDTLGFLVAPIVAVVWGQLPIWYLSLSVARYLYRAAVWLRRRRGRAVGDLPPPLLRRPLAAVQMAFITAALAPATPAGPVAAVAVAVLVPSLAAFGWDYLLVTGRATPVVADG